MDKTPWTGDKTIQKKFSLLFSLFLFSSFACFPDFRSIRQRRSFSFNLTSKVKDKDNQNIQPKRQRKKLVKNKRQSVQTCQG